MELSIDKIVEEKVVDEVKKVLTDVKATKLLNELLLEHRKVEVSQPGKEVIKLDEVPHKDFETVLKYVSAKLNLMLVGPAGCGKTHIASLCATALNIPHFSISVNEQTSKSDFMGYMDAMGKLVQTNFRKCYENGGMFIVDEIDCANPNILTIINSALSNDFCPFPDGMVKRHEDFFCICTANTFGEGENVAYIGRNILDAATKDRFATLLIGYDTKLEKKIDEKATRLVEKLRQYCVDNNVNYVFSTRAIQRIKKLRQTKGAELTAEELKNCLNLHNIKDSKVDKILSTYEKI